LEDPLPEGPFDLVVSALAVHHLHADSKADLFQRIAKTLEPGGRFVLADVVTPLNPSYIVTAIDYPSTLDEQLAWLDAAAISPEVIWTHRELVVIGGTARMSAPRLESPRCSVLDADLGRKATRLGERLSKRVRARMTARASRHEEHASRSQLGGRLNGVAAATHTRILAR
jgi:cyclopropane fatty-acyl-phospholipid synthase-like methyltransferase